MQLLRIVKGKIKERLFPDSVLNTPPKYNVENQIHALKLEKDTYCIICADTHKCGEMGLRTACNHTFGEECGRLWLKQSSKCGMCHRDLELPIMPSVSTNLISTLLLYYTLSNTFSRTRLGTRTAPSRPVTSLPRVMPQLEMRPLLRRDGDEGGEEAGDEQLSPCNQANWYVHTLLL